MNDNNNLFSSSYLRLKAGGEGDDRGWDGWMASLTRWTWVWASCRSWWWTGSLACFEVFWGAMQGVVPSLVQNWVSSWAKLVLSKYSRFLKIINPYILGFPGGASGKEPTYQCRRLKRHAFHPWVGRIP